MSPVTRGLVIGKFMPPHRGHCYLLEEAQRGCDLLTIVVCSLKREPIPGQLRFRWIRELFPNARVLHLSDDTIPQEPSEHPDFWNIWRRTLKGLHPETIDYVFSSETYGDRLAAELGAQHRCVDHSRMRHPTSGTMVRTSPMHNWHDIATVAQPYFARSILVTGPESCGKSTLTEKLAKHFRTVGVQEYARSYLEKIGYDFDIQDLNLIAVRQYDECQKARSTCNRFFFSDTSAVETDIYARHYLGHSSKIIEGLLSVKWDLTLLLTPEVPWVSDNQRNLPHYRKEMFELFKDLLVRQGHKLCVIGGESYEARFNTAVKAVEDEVING